MRVGVPPHPKSSEKDFKGPLQDSGMGKNEHYHVAHASSL